MSYEKAEVIQRLSKAEGITFISLVPLNQSHAILKLLWFDKPISLTVSISEVLEFDIPKQQSYIKTATGKTRGRSKAPRGEYAKSEHNTMPYTKPETLKALVEELGSQRAVAERLGVSETVISKWWLAHGFPQLRPSRSIEKHQITYWLNAGVDH